MRAYHLQNSIKLVWNLKPILNFLRKYGTHSLQLSLVKNIIFSKSKTPICKPKQIDQSAAAI
jgi:hypothetical protein